MKRNLLFLVLSLAWIPLLAQDFIGSGNTDVVVTTSSNSGQTSGENVINGKGLNARFYEASRFLSQSALVYNENDVTALEDLDFEAWIDAEMDKPITYLLPIHDEEFQEAKDLYYANGGTGSYYGPSDKHFNYAWWTLVTNADDQLRQRVALALSEIFVISGQGDLGAFGEGLSDYYDKLLEGAFGNFRELIEDITYHPCMAYYLSHLNNPKTQGSIRPDENFAREIMQLFTIGLFELNNDGTFKLDNQGNAIPTYGQDEIKEFAKVFTGLRGGGWDPDNNNSGIPNFGVGIFNISKTERLVPYESQHEPGIKYLLNGATTNSNTDGDIEAALDNLFYHPNVGPFIARRLIQRLVKSNPSPAYINRVASAFNNTNGERGNMGAVVKQILMDEEAREGDYINGPNSGMLREPIVKFANVVGFLDKDNPSGNLWNNGFDFMDATGQHPMQSPTVFNFFLPDFEPNQLNNLYGPEFQIWNTISSINWVNYVHRWAVWETLFWDWEGDYTENVYVDYTSRYEGMANNIEEFINYFDMVLTHGTLSDHSRNEIRTAMAGISNPYNRARLGLYLILVTPEFSVLH